ncbi:MAG: type II toxin-antitoxin system VapC family toxin [Microbacterium sp.]
MIGYFDSSSIAPILIHEASEQRCRALWQDASQIVTSRVTYVEAQSAIAAAVRSSRIDLAQASSARTLLDDMWREVHVMELTPDLMYGAVACAHEYALRGFDAIHCASAMTLGGVDVLAVSGDKHLLRAWLRGGLAVADTSTVYGGGDQP